MEQTYIMLKPDAVRRGLMGEIIGRIEKKGFKIVKMKMFMLDEQILREHYAHIADRPFFPLPADRRICLLRYCRSIGRYPRPGPGCGKSCSPPGEG